ncbi:MAG: transcriptional repressor NrdR [Polyangiaceae bacterium]|nr:transcriptional repressor NrdR [Polyangiaceae bacterium]
MRCPFCGMMESRVVDSRLAAEGTVTWRRRECDACRRRFTTYERVEHALPMVKKRDGKREPFDRGKILRSLRIACNKRPVSADELEAQVEALEREFALSGEREIVSQTIGERVMDRLKTLDEVAYVRFASVYRSFRDVGDFIEEMGKLVREKPTE